MRLINTTTLKLHDFSLQQKPPYAILSHTWEYGQEVSFQEFQATPAPNSEKRGWEKIAATCKQAREDGLSYVWVDTCCIDKSSSAELSEAINSMYKWYKDSAICYVYLADASADLPPNFENLRDCRWWIRGWTLQELLAPRKQDFYDRSWTRLGSKAQLGRTLAECAGIRYAHLFYDEDHNVCSVSTRMAWYGKRTTTRIEDEAYCLLGIFGVNMPLIYGEGKRAFRRLQEEIAKRSNDLSLFAHSPHRNDADRSRSTSLLAESPSDYRPVSIPYHGEFEMISSGIRYKDQLGLVFVEIQDNVRGEIKVYFWCLGLDEHGVIGICLRKLVPGAFCRREEPLGVLQLASKAYKRRMLAGTQLMIFFDRFSGGVVSDHVLKISLDVDQHMRLLALIPGMFWDVEESCFVIPDHQREANRVCAALYRLRLPDPLDILVLLRWHTDSSSVEVKLLELEHGSSGKRSSLALFLEESQRDLTSLVSWPQIELLAPWVAKHGPSLDTRAGLRIVANSTWRRESDTAISEIVLRIDETHST